MEILLQKHRKETAVLRNLAKQYLDICHTDAQKERRELWRSHNSLKRTRIPIIVRGGECWREIDEINHLKTAGTPYAAMEKNLRLSLYRDSLKDDYIFEPFFTVPASYVFNDGLPWGVQQKHVARTEEGGGHFYADPPLKTVDDFKKLKVSPHKIDEAAAKTSFERTRDAFGDIVPVVQDRKPFFLVWQGDISTQLAQLRGLDTLMMDMIDHPKELHELLSVMRDGILAAHDQAEADGDFHIYDHENQSMPYCQELDDPAPDETPVKRRALWHFQAAQELTLVSPAMHKEFMLDYQIPIMARFGLSSYGCCEDLTDKIDIVRAIPNLRRIAVTPVANVKKCAEKIGSDYVMSYRPNPAEMVCCGFDPDHVARFLRQALIDAGGGIIEICLKDIQTVQNDANRLREWVKTARRVTEEF